jgi:hypothetical protein
VHKNYKYKRFALCGGGAPRNEVEDTAACFCGEVEGHIGRAKAASAQIFVDHEPTKHKHGVYFPQLTIGGSTK